MLGRIGFRARIGREDVLPALEAAAEADCHSTMNAWE